MSFGQIYIFIHYSSLFLKIKKLCPSDRIYIFILPLMLVNIIFIHKIDWRIYHMCNFFTLIIIIGSLQSHFTNFSWLLSNRCGHCPCFYGIMCFRLTINSKNSYFLSSGLHSFSCSQCHFIILRKDCLDVFMRLEHILSRI